MGGTEFGSFGYLLGPHWLPSVGETVEYLTGLAGEFLDPGLEIGGLFVDEAFEILESGAERRINQDTTREHQEPRVAAGHSADGFQATLFVVQRSQDLEPTFVVRERREYSPSLFRSESFENEEPEELVKRFAVAMNGFKDGVGGANEEDLGTLDQGSAQLMDLTLVA